MVKDNALGPFTAQELLLRMRGVITWASVRYPHSLPFKEACRAAQPFKAHLASALPLQRSDPEIWLCPPPPLFSCHGFFNDLMRKMSKLTFLFPRSSHTTLQAVLVPFDICEFKGSLIFAHI